MKRLTAIFFLCLLFFNIAGYRLWFHFAEKEATAQLAAHVAEEQYNAADLITLTVPLSLPYQTDWSGWEKVRGEIEIDGVVYQYVQRKVEQGQVVLQCLPNKQQAKIESARDRFFELANSLQGDTGQKKEGPANTIKVTKPSLTDFDDHWTCWQIAACSETAKQNTALAVSKFPQPSMPVPAQPPEWIA